MPDEPTREELSALAAGLTKAQRNTVLRARETPLITRWKCETRSKAMRRLGVTVQAWRGGDLLTPLGLALKQHLESEGEKR